MASCQNVRNTVVAHSRAFFKLCAEYKWYLLTHWLRCTIWNLMQADLVYLLWDFWVEASLKSVGITAVLWLWAVFKMPELHKVFLLSSYVYELCLLPNIHRFCIQIHVWFCLVRSRLSLFHTQMMKLSQHVFKTPSTVFQTSVVWDACNFLRTKLPSVPLLQQYLYKKAIAIEEWEPNILFLLIWSLQQMQQFIFEQCRYKHKICKFFVNFVSLWRVEGS